MNLTFDSLSETLPRVYHPIPRVRDSQRKKVYDAEDAVFSKTCKADFKTVDQCQAFVDSVLARKRVQDRYPRAKRPIPVRPGQGARRAFARANDITLPLWARRRSVILHELAHVLTRNQGAAHGWEFAACFLWLVRQSMGAEVEARLEASFKAHKVRYRKPRERKPLTPEQREAAVARLAAARQAKADKKEVSS